MESKNAFIELNQVDVNDHVEKKDTGRVVLSYLSWPWAWAEVKKRYPEANYTIIKNDNGLPYFSDPVLGIMVYTEMTINGITHTMWLPVMDSSNAAMKETPYEIKTKYGVKRVEAATMFDVNKTIMRCLVKNIAMFGLGLYIYAGEDLPEESESKQAEVTSLISEIDKVIKVIIKDYNSEQKRALSAEVIVPTIGMANYKLCKDAEKLQKLLDILNKKNGD